MEKSIVKTDRELAEFYDYLYKTPDSKGRLYEFINRRAASFIDYMVKNVAKGSVLEIGCGRGQLLRWMKYLGYQTSGTEIADCLFKDELYGMPVTKMFCSELHKVGDSSYDCVVSSDVIEHLPTEADAEKMMADMARIFRKDILLSTGGMRAATSLRGRVHYVIKPRAWWEDLFKKYADIKTSFEAVGSLFIFGVKK